jgi:hypothetical protein
MLPESLSLALSRSRGPEGVTIPECDEDTFRGLGGAFKKEGSREHGAPRTRWGGEGRRGADTVATVAPRACNHLQPRLRSSRLLGQPDSRLTRCQPLPWHFSQCTGLLRR